MRKIKSPSFLNKKKQHKLSFQGSDFTRFFEVVQIQNLSAFILPFSFVESAE